MDRFDKVYYRIKNEIKYVKKAIQLVVDKKQRRVLDKNIELYNIHKGQRCFIVGNGPSLREQDLSLLKDEMVFTVNYFAKSPLYKDVKSNYHVLMDPGIFDFSSTNKDEKLRLLYQINSVGNSPICFAQYNVKQSVENVGLDDQIKFYYVNSEIGLYERYKRKINLTKVNPGFSNVVLYATMIAIYMGFSEIYYIGCDMTGYEQISLMAGKKVDLHVYEMDEKEKEMMKDRHYNMLPEDFFEGFYHMFFEYRVLNDFAKKQGVHLYNATKGGVLDSIERVDYEALFK